MASHTAHHTGRTLPPSVPHKGCHALDDLVEVRDDTTLIDDDQNAELSRIGYAQLAVIDRLEQYLDNPDEGRRGR